MNLNESRDCEELRECKLIIFFNIPATQNTSRSLFSSFPSLLDELNMKEIKKVNAVRYGAEMNSRWMGKTRRRRENYLRSSPTMMSYHILTCCDTSSLNILSGFPVSLQSETMLRSSSSPSIAFPFISPPNFKRFCPETSWMGLIAQLEWWTIRMCRV